MSWAPVSRNLNLIPEESANGSASVTVGDRLYIFGGDGRSKENRSNALLELDLAEESLRVVPCPTIPGRFMHTAVLYESPAGAYMVLFGGVDQNDAVVGDAWAIAVGPGASFQCSPLRYVGSVKPRAGHTAVVWEGGMWAFGGMDLLYFWKEYRVQASFDVMDMASLRWDSVPAVGTAPSPRMDHSCKIWNQKMLLYGGSSNNRNDFHNDLYCFEFSSFTWTEIVVTSISPSPRIGVGMVVYNDWLVFFGGRVYGSQYVDNLLVFDLQRRRWFTALDAGRRPSIRWCPIAEQVNGFLVIAGGSKRKSGLVSRHMDCRKVRIADLKLQELDNLSVPNADGPVQPQRPSSPEPAILALSAVTPPVPVAGVTCPACATSFSPLPNPPEVLPATLSLSLAEAESRLRSLFEGIADAEALVQRAERKIAALRAEAEMLMAHCQRLREREAHAVSEGEDDAEEWEEELPEASSGLQAQDEGWEEEEEDGEGEWWSEAAEDGGQADGGERWADADEWNGWASSTTPLAQRGWSIADETACPARPARDKWLAAALSTAPEPSPARRPQPTPAYAPRESGKWYSPTGWPGPAARRPTQTAGHWRAAGQPLPSPWVREGLRWQAGLDQPHTGSGGGGNGRWLEGRQRDSRQRDPALWRAPGPQNGWK